MNTFFCRAFQCCFAVGARFLPWRTPEVFSGEGSLLRAADILRENGLRRPFVIASRRQCADEHFRALQEKLDEQDILLSIFSSVEPNPSVETVEKIAAQYKIDSCDCFLVIGGGSPMDSAKAIALLAVSDIERKNLFDGNIGNKALPMIHIPTTAGTGSEVTPYAILTRIVMPKIELTTAAASETSTEAKAGELVKQSISHHIFPELALVDSTYLQTASKTGCINTAVDTLAHLVESHLNTNATPYSLSLIHI